MHVCLQWWLYSDDNVGRWYSQCAHCQVLFKLLYECTLSLNFLFKQIKALPSFGWYRTSLLSLFRCICIHVYVSACTHHTLGRKHWECSEALPALIWQMHFTQSDRFFTHNIWISRLLQSCGWMHILTLFLCPGYGFGLDLSTFRLHYLKNSN